MQVRLIRPYLKDRVFFSLFLGTVLTLALALASRQAEIERTAIPFQLTLFFFTVNVLFAFITLRREPLLAYMFLTASILGNGTLYFFYRYLLTVQTG